MKKRRLKLKLLPKFVVSLTILGVVLTVVISLFSYVNTRAYLEDMYAQRVVFGAQSIATMLSVDDVRTIISEGGDQTEAYTRTAELLTQLKKDGDITFLSLTTKDADSVTFYIDICIPEMGDDPAAQMPYGTDVLYTDAASSPEDLENYTIGWELFQQNVGTSEPLITDNDYGYNFTASWPVLDENGQAIAEIQYILDMRDVRSYLNSVLYTMLGISLGIIGVAVVCYILFVRRTVTRPIGRLAAQMESVTAAGEFQNQHIDLHTGDRLFVYTDGVAEATDAGNNLYGTDRMLAALNGCRGETLEELLHGVKADIDGFVGEAPQFDDITMLGFQVK